MKKTKKILITVHEKLHKDFKEVCEENYQSISAVIRVLMLQYIKEHKDEDCTQ